MQKNFAVGAWLSNFCHGFLTSVMALATLWESSVQKWSFYESGEKF